MSPFSSGGRTEAPYKLSREDVISVAGLRRGDETTYRTLMDRHDRAMNRLASNYVRDPDTAREVVQDTWMVVLEGIDRFEGRSSLKTWIYNILVNRAQTRGVKESRSVPWASLRTSDGDGPSDTDASDPLEWLTDTASGTRPRTTTAAQPKAPDASAQDGELMRLISQCILGLPVGQRAVITLRDIYGCPSAEVCERLKLSPTHQRVLLHRARVAVRNALSPYLSSDNATAA